MPLIGDAHRSKHHACTNVEIGLDQEIKVSLLKCHFAFCFAPLHKRVFNFQLAPKFDALRKAMAE